MKFLDITEVRMKDNRESLFNSVNSLLIENNKVKVPKKITIVSKPHLPHPKLIDKIPDLFVNEYARECLARPFLIDENSRRIEMEVEKGTWEESIDDLNEVVGVLADIRGGLYQTLHIARMSLDRKDVQSIFDEEHCFYLGRMDDYNLGIWISGDSVSLTHAKVGEGSSGYHSVGLVRDGKILEDTFKGWDFNAGTELTKLNKEIYKRAIKHGFLTPRN